MRKKRNTVFTVLLVLLVLLLPFFTVATAVFCIPAQYRATFLGALEGKYERLTTLEGEKIVIVGGSSVAFGIDSELIEEYTDRKVVNFGLYAALGTKLMMDLSRAGIGEGDIVLLAPELDPETLSLAFYGESTWQAIEGNFSMLRYIAAEDRSALFGSAFSYAEQKLAYALSGKAPEPSGIYASSSFDEHGDIKYPREKNEMFFYYDKNKTISLTPEIFSAEFVDYVNEYVHFCKQKGATVYFSYCPINRLALSSDTTEESIAAVESYLDGALECPVLGHLNDAVMEEGYFYDTNFHLNDAGAVAHTVRYIEDLLLELESDVYITTDVPAAPALPESDTRLFLEDENDKYFTFREEANGGYVITGLTDLGRAELSLTVPLAYQNCRVLGIAEGAFGGEALRELHIPAQSGEFRIANGAFTGASAFSELYLHEADAQRILPPNGFYGVSPSFRIHVPAGAPYAEDYNWSGLRLTYVYDVGE